MLDFMVLSKYYVESTWNEWNVVDVKRKSSFTTKKKHTCSAIQMKWLVSMWYFLASMYLTDLCAVSTNLGAIWSCAPRFYRNFQESLKMFSENESMEELEINWESEALLWYFWVLKESLKHAETRIFSPSNSLSGLDYRRIEFDLRCC